MATTNKVKGWTGVLMTEDSSSHWPIKRRYVYSETSRRASLEFVCIFGHDGLARLEKRPPRADVWPGASIDQIEALLNETSACYAEYLASLSAAALDTMISYTNSAGKEFTSSVGDILLYVALHGQYHRGQVNLLLRDSSLEPAPTDYIAFGPWPRPPQRAKHQSHDLPCSQFRTASSDGSDRSSPSW